MTQSEYSVGDEPAIRKAASGRDPISGYPCPFCGGNALLRSSGDLPQDTERVEVYCDNQFCDAREIVILITRGEGTHARADVRALSAVDDGTEAEQEADGYELDRDETGNGRPARLSRSGRRSRVVGRSHHAAMRHRGRPPT
jgi:hypothetical protein